MVTHLKSVPHNPRLRYIAAGLIVVLAVGSGAFLLLRLYSGLNVLSGKRGLHEKNYAAASVRFETALRFQPNDPAIWKDLGAAYRGLSAQETIQKAFEWEKTAKGAFLEASRLNPLDSSVFYHLAMVEQSLEKLALFMGENQNGKTFNADPYFEEALRLNPNALHIHYVLIRRLHQNGKKDELRGAIRSLVHMHPSSVSSLKNELFWSPAFNQEARRGLEQAIAEGIDPGTAHEAISSILADEEEWDGAIQHYQQALAHKSAAVSRHDKYHLGRMFLKNARYDAAAASFIHALALEQSREKGMERLYGVYRSANALDEFDPFLQRARQSFAFTDRMEIVYARVLMDQERLNMARRVLDELNRNHPTPEAWYLLARVEEKEKDWGAMELAIQKAVVMDPDNARYHRVFAGVLRRRKKPERAEKHERLAEQLAEKGVDRK